MTEAVFLRLIVRIDRILSLTWNVRPSEKRSADITAAIGVITQEIQPKSGTSNMYAEIVPTIRDFSATDGRAPTDRRRPSQRKRHIPTKRATTPPSTPANPLIPRTTSQPS